MTTHAELIEAAARWLRRKSCVVIITDMTSGCGETPDAIGWTTHASFLIECKASRADFLVDGKKRHRRYPGHAMGLLRYYAAPAGMLRPDEMPEGWGLLEVLAGRAILVRESRSFRGQTDREHEITVLCSALRRMVCQPAVRGVMCKTYVIDTGGEPRATVAALTTQAVTP